MAVFALPIHIQHCWGDVHVADRIYTPSSIVVCAEIKYATANMHKL